MAGKYKLLIVDDEYLVRKGVVQTVDWSSLDIEVVAECENGKQALAAVAAYRPDLILSDVRMPVMDGLELAEALARDNFDGAIIFYSGYSDFEYVRKALEYGVSGYVLKPEENDSLTRKISETLAALEERRQRSSALRSLASGAPYLREMYFEKLEEGTDDGSLREQLSYLNIVVPSAGTAVYGKALRVQDGTFAQLYEKLMRALENFNAVGSIREDKFLIVTSLEDTEALCECAERLLSEHSAAETPFAAVGVSSPFGAFLTLREAVAQAKRAASPVLGVGGVYTGGENGLRGNKKPKKLVEDALALIVGHYAERITVRWAAEKLFVSESHLMHEFKVETGKTFNDCLKHIRIAKAKELLRRGDMRVNEIAAEVGFADGRYFGQVFRELVGVTPSEYAELIHEEK